MGLDEVCRRYLSGHTHGCLATVGPGGRPQNKPVGFRYNAELGTLDISGCSMETSAKYRNVAVRPDVAFVVEDIVSEGAEGVRFLEVRGRAEQVWLDPSPTDGLSPHIIRIEPRRVVSWNIDPDYPGMRTSDLGAHEDDAPPRGSERPSGPS